MIEPIDIKAVIKNVKRKLCKVGLDYIHFAMEPLGDSFVVKFYTRGHDSSGVYNEKFDTFSFKPYELAIPASTPKELEYGLLDKSFEYLRLQVFDNSETGRYEFARWEMEL